MTVIETDWYRFPPIQAGADPSGRELTSLLQEAAKAGAKQALNEVRAEAKRGRNDQGNGSKALGDILRRYRTENNWTQKDLAAAAGIHPTTIGKIESGDRGMSLQTFALLSWILCATDPDDTFIWETIKEVASWPSS